MKARDARPQGRRRRRPGRASSATSAATTGSLARIVEVEPRRTVLRRTADDDDPIERVDRRQRRPARRSSPRSPIPPPRAGLIDRCLVAAFDAGMEPLLVPDQVRPRPPRRRSLATATRPLGVPRRRDPARTATSTTARARCATGPACSSGTAASASRRWSTRWCPTPTARSGYVNAVTGRGRHTSTSAIGLRAARAAAGSSTPPASARSGWRTSSSTTSSRRSPTSRTVTARLPARLHATRHEPECALDVAVADGTLPPERVESFRRILASMNQQGRLLSPCRTAAFGGLKPYSEGHGSLVQRRPAPRSRARRQRRQPLDGPLRRDRSPGRHQAGHDAT